jgi:gluconokinase
MVIVVMGVTGAGKTTVGSSLAAASGWRFVDADTLHPAANVEKMRAGVPLTEADRAPWLAAVHAVVARAIERREPLVVACSALARRYRIAIAADLRGVRFVYLRVPETIAASRTAQRRGHFAPAAIVAAQFTTLEEPTPADALVVDGTQPPEQIVAAVQTDFGL